MTLGILMEKNSAAAHGAAAWGGASGTFEGQDYVIVAARGHLYEYKRPHEMVPGDRVETYRRWSTDNLPWDLDDFDWAMTPISGTSDVRREIRSTLADCDEIAIACDDDPTGEGDAIAINAIRELGLDRGGRRFSRMYFTDESTTSLQQAFRDRKPVPSLVDHPAYRKAKYRAAWDFTSMQFSRVATIAARESGQDVVLPQGRLKSAMVSLVGDQLKAHHDYVKKPFFQNRFVDENKVVYTNPDEPHFDAKEKVPGGYSPSAVAEDSRTEKSTAPPKLLDLAALSSLLVSKGVKAKLTLSTYQKMYEAQIVSYPRTEDTTITPEQFNELLPLVDRIAGVVGIDTSLLTHRTPRKTHVKAQGAHGANRPGLKVPSSLEEVESRFGKAGRLIYEVLASNYLATLAEDYRYIQVKGHVQDYPAFRGYANVPTVQGWKQVFDTSAGDAEEKKAEADEHENSAGLGTRAEPFVHEGANKRPTHPSMKWLMAQLAKRDVGTGATRTSTYSDVTNARAKYPLLAEKGKKLTLAHAGELSWHLLPGTHIGDLATTEKVYADMAAIAAGQAQGDQLLNQMATWVREDMSTMDENAKIMRGQLGLPQGKVPAKERASGTWVPAGEEVSFGRTWGEHRFTDEEVQALLAGEMISFSARSKAGKDFDVHGRLARKTHQGRDYVGFDMVGFGKLASDGSALPPSSWCQHTFTSDEIDQLLSGGAVEAADFVSSKTGNTFACAVFFTDKDGKGKKIVPDFGSDDSPPRSWCQRIFSPEEREALERGESLQLEGFTSKKGKAFSATVTWTEEKGRKRIVPSFG